jgi:hypothetical protein
MTKTQQLALYQAIETLPDNFLVELLKFIEFLRFKAQQEELPKPKPRQRGTAKHLISSMSPDFDEPLADFAEYMP